MANLLLDTQIFIWAYAKSRALPKRISDALDDENNQLYLSAASSWEMQIKEQIGKLNLPSDAESFIELEMALNNIQLLPIGNRYVWTLKQLPLHHRDPFDRMIIAQAIADDLTLISADRIFIKYPVTLF